MLKRAAHMPVSAASQASASCSMVTLSNRRLWVELPTKRDSTMSVLGTPKAEQNICVAWELIATRSLRASACTSALPAAVSSRGSCRSSGLELGGTNEVRSRPCCCIWYLRPTTGELSTGKREHREARAPGKREHRAGAHPALGAVPAPLEAVDHVAELHLQGECLCALFVRSAVESRLDLAALAVEEHGSGLQGIFVGRLVCRLGHDDLLGTQRLGAHRQLEERQLCVSQFEAGLCGADNVPMAVGSLPHEDARALVGFGGC